MPRTAEPSPAIGRARRPALTSTVTLVLTMAAISAAPLTAPPAPRATPAGPLTLSPATHRTAAPPASVPSPPPLPAPVTRVR